MSVLNYFIGGRKIVILSDTMSYTADNKPFRLNAGKTFISDNGLFAYAFRGPNVMNTVYGPDLAPLATVEEAANAFGYFAKSMPEWAYGQGGGIEATFFGFFGLTGEPSVYRYRARELVTETLMPEVVEPGLHCYPSFPLNAKLPASADEGTLIRLALVQHKIGPRFNLPLCIGGAMTITTVSPAGAVQHIGGVYPDYDQHAAELGGDPLAEQVAAFRARAGEMAA